MATVTDVVTNIRQNIRLETEKFEKFVIEEVGPCARPTKGEKKVGIPLAGISKFLSIFVQANGKLTGSNLSCHQCTVKTLCNRCRL